MNSHEPAKVVPGTVRDELVLRASVITKVCGGGNADAVKKSRDLLRWWRTRKSTRRITWSLNDLVRKESSEILRAPPSEAGRWKIWIHMWRYVVAVLFVFRGVRAFAPPAGWRGSPSATRATVRGKCAARVRVVSSGALFEREGPSDSALARHAALRAARRIVRDFDALDDAVAAITQGSTALHTFRTIDRDTLRRLEETPTRVCERERNATDRDVLSRRRRPRNAEAWTLAAAMAVTLVFAVLPGARWCRLARFVLPACAAVTSPGVSR